LIQLDFTKLEKKVFKKGDFLFRNGDLVDYVYYIVTGAVQATFIGDYNIEYVNRYRDSADGGIEPWLGVAMLFQNNGISDMDIMAATDVICYKIEKNDIIEYLLHNPELLLELYKDLCYQYDIRGERLALRQARRSDSALCSLLLESAKSIDGVICIDKQITNESLAKRLGLHPVTVSRILGQLIKENIISRSKQGLIICDKDTLMDYAAGIRILAYRKKKQK